jgi:hypothetical protein
MNIEEAIEKFQAKRKGRFSPDDKQLIVATAAELNLSNFEIKQRLDVKTKMGIPTLSTSMTSRTLFIFTQP